MIGYLHIFSPVISLGVNVMCQVCCCRYIRGFSLLKSIFVGFALGILSLLFLEFYCFKQLSLSLSGNVCSILVSAVTYSALGYGYFHFVNLGETARRIRILRELYDSKEGLSMGEILERYNAKDIIEKRIYRLINSGQIIYKNGRYYIGSPVMLVIARIVVRMKLTVLGKKSEFE